MLLTKYEILGIVGIAISFTIIGANLFSNKKLSFTSIIIALIIAISYGIKLFRKELFQDYFGSVPRVELTFLLASFVGAMLSGIIYLIDTYKTYIKEQLFKLGIFYDESSVLAYVSKNYKIYKFSDKVVDILDAREEDEDHQLILKSACVGQRDIKLKKLEKELAHCDGLVNEVVEFKFKYMNGLTTELKVVKKPVTKNKDSKKIYGYILLDNTITNSYKVEVTNEFKRNLFIYLDFINQPLAYYDQDSQEYIASNALSELLGVDNNKINVEQLESWMHPEDIASYQTRKIEENEMNINYYRLLTGNTYTWFEERTAQYFKNKFMLMKKVDAATASRISYGNYKSMVKYIDELIESNKTFAVIMINLTNMPEITSKMGQNYTSILTNKFMDNILSGSLKDQVTIYKLGAIEYALVIDGEEYIQLAIHDLDNNTSEILAQDLYINRNKHRLECQAGIVSSIDFKELDTRTIIKTTFDTLKEAMDTEFLKDYNIYQSAERVTKEYNLSDLGIDLDNDDLSEYTIDEE